MHAANSHLIEIGKCAPESILNGAERRELELRLVEDAKNYYQSALVSLVDGMRSIPTGFYSWSTVKLYYSTFYALRARLAIAGECIFYESSKPRYVNVNPGCSVKKMKGTTHKCVLERFTASYPGDFFLSQDIAAEKPLSWLMDKREEVNYKIPRFSEPEAPNFLKYAASTDLRSMLSSYQMDDVYVFDPDHAIVAFPFRLMLDLRSRLLNRGVTPLAKIETDFLSQRAKDRSGVITALVPLLA